MSRTHRTAWMLLVAVSLAASIACSGGPPEPGEDGFDAADRQISSSRGQEAFGNGPEAEKMAKSFAVLFKTMRVMAFSESRKTRNATELKFPTYCHVTSTHVVFLVQVPELRNFKEDAQAMLLELAWTTAQSIATRLPGHEGMRLGVGLRGTLLYGGLAIGSAAAEKAERMETRGVVLREDFYPFFTGAYPADLVVKADSAAK